MTKSTLTTRGFEEYLERIARAGDDVDAVADEALMAGAEILLDGMNKRAPVETGNLVSKLKIIGPVNNGNYHSVKIGLFDVNREKEMYFFYQELGSAKRPAHPFIRPTFKEDSKRARAKMLEIFKQRGAV